MQRERRNQRLVSVRLRRTVVDRSDARFLDASQLRQQLLGSRPGCDEVVSSRCCGQGRTFLGHRHHARSRDQRKSATPRAKNSKKRAKKRGPISAEIKKNSLIDLFLRIQNIPLSLVCMDQVFTANRQGSPNKRDQDIIAVRWNIGIVVPFAQ